MSVSPRVILLCVATLLFWGLWAFFGKIALVKRMTPAGMLLAETSISCLCAFAVAIVMIASAKAHALTLSSWNIFGVLSGAGLAFGLLTYYFALEQGSISIVSPVTAAYPVISVALAYAILGERPSPMQWCGIALVVTGTVLLFGSASPQGDGENGTLGPPSTGDSAAKQNRP